MKLLRHTKSFLGFLALAGYAVHRVSADSLRTCTKVDGSSACEVSTAIANNSYCHFNNGSGKDDKIYISDSTQATDKCKAIDDAVILIKADSTKGTIGNDPGYIYVKGTDDDTYTQVAANIYYLFSDDRLYSCNASQVCSNVDNSVEGGSYLAGPNSIIYCTGTNVNTCTKLDNPLPGYYLNGGGDIGKNVITCTGSACSLTSDVTTDCSAKGEIRFVGSKVKFCVEKGAAATKEISASTTAGFASLTVEANKFPGVTSAGDIIVEYGKGFVKLVKEFDLPACDLSHYATACFNGAETGQHCFNSDGKIYEKNSATCEAVGSDGAVKNFYFKSDNTAVTSPTAGETDIVVAYQCYFKDEDDDGTYEELDSCVKVKGYLIGDSLAVQCTGWEGHNCVVATKPSSKECDGGEGALCSNGEKIDFDSGVALPGSGSQWYVLDLAEANGNYGVGAGLQTLYLAADTAIVKAVAGASDTAIRYFVNQSYDSGDALDKPLIKCTGSTCVKETPVTKDGMVYVNSAKAVGSVISCDENGCTEKAVAAPNTIYISAVDSSANKYPKILECSNAAACETKAGDGYYVNGLVTGNNAKGLIHCSEGDCKVVDGQSGYYLNADASDKQVIACGKISAVGCSALAKVTASSSTTVGELFVEDTTKIMVYLNGDGDKEELKAGGDSVYHTISVAAQNDFPGVDNSATADIKFIGDGSVVLLEKVTGLTTCDTNNCGTSGQLYINGSGVLKKGGDASACDAVTIPGIFGINSEDKQEALTAGSTSVTKVYVCDTEKCYLLQGYAINSTHIIHCTGWKNEPCTITAKSTFTSCGATDHGKIKGTGVGVCFNDGVSLDIPATGKVYVGISDASFNEIYGISESAVAFLELAKVDTNLAYVRVLESTASPVGYTLNTMVTTGLDNAVIKCTGANLSTCDVVPSATAGYYQNASVSSGLANAIIQCTTGDKCKLVATATAGYYLNADVNNSLSNALIKCTESQVAEETKCELVATATAGFYLNAAVNDSLTGALIQCIGNPTNKCQLVETVAPGYYLNALVDDSLEKALFVCKDKCELVATAAAGYYLNGAIASGLDNVLIVCTDKCQLVATAVAGYYLNNGYDKTSKPLLICSSNCESSIANDGYYVDNGAKEIITCSKGVCSEIDIDDSSCTKAGMLVNDGDIKLCTSASDANPKDITNSATVTFKVTSAENFPGTSKDQTITVTIVGNKAVKMEVSGLKSCKTTIQANDVCFENAEDGQHCLNASKIYKTTIKTDGAVTTKKCEPVKGSHSTEYVYLTGEGQEVTGLEDDLDTIFYVYECKFTGDDYTLDSCSLVTGYLISSNFAVSCNGWAGDKCVVKALSTGQCNTGKKEVLGHLNLNKEICFAQTASDGIALAEKEIDFFDAEPNAIYGQSGLIRLAVSAHRISVLPNPTVTPTTPAYFFNSADAAHPVIYYHTTNSQWKTDVFVKGSSTKPEYAYIDASDPTKKTIIAYDGTNTAFNSIDLSGDLISGNQYYIYDLGDTKIIKCTAEAGCAIIDGGGSATKTTYYIDSGNLAADTKTTIIKCDSEKCQSVAHGGDSKVYFIDSGIPGNILTCKNDAGCSSTPGVVGAAYIDKDDGDTKSVITCNDNHECLSKSHTSGSTYYIHGANPKEYILCNGTNCAASTGTTLAAVDGTDTTKVISCLDGQGCFSTKPFTACVDTDPSHSCTYNDGSGGDPKTLSKGYCMKTNQIFTFNAADHCEYVGSNGAVTLFIDGTTGETFEDVSFASDKTGLIFDCAATSSGKCSQYISTNYLYVDPEKPTLKYLYSCDATGLCQKINSISVGYYLSGVTKYDTDNVLYSEKLIYCSTNDVSSCTGEVTVAAGYYLDAKNSGNVIKCVTDTDKCKSVPASTEQGVAYIDASQTPKTHVITCQGGKCTSWNAKEGLSVSENRYFINGDANNEIITCNGSTNCATGACTKVVDNTLISNSIESINSKCVSTPECRVNTGVNCEADTYYLVKPGSPSSTINADYLLGTITEDGKEVGFLHYCKSNAEGAVECTLVESIGVYYDRLTDKEYSCTTVNSKVKCYLEVLGTCAVGQEGKLFIDEHLNVAVCLEGNAEVQSRIKSTLSTLAPNNVLPSIQSKGNALMDGEAANANDVGLLKIGKDSVVKALDFNYTHSYYVYIDTTTDEVLLEGNDKDLEYVQEYFCTPSTGICVVVDPPL